MDLYRVSRSQCDWLHATLNREATSQGRKEPDNILVPLGNLHRMEFDARTSILIGSFLDVAGACCSLILSEVLEDDQLPDKARDTTQHVVDFQKSRGKAVEHLMATVSLLDANVNMMRHQAAIRGMELRSRCKIILPATF